MSPPAAVYALAYVEVRRKQSGGIVHGYVWAAWWTCAPLDVDGQWQSPDAGGVIEQTEQHPAWGSCQVRAEMAADDACREALAFRAAQAREVAELLNNPPPPRVVPTTRRIDDAHARAAERERLSRPANYRAPKASRYARPRGFDRPPEMSARDFFAGGARSIAVPDALRVFDLGADATREDVLRVYRQRVKDAHPDRGGAGGDFAAMRRQRDEALRVVGGAS